MAGISDDVENLRVNRNDFMNAFDEVQPAFGVSEEELQGVIQNGIIHFAPHVDVCINPLGAACDLTVFDRNYSKPDSFSLSKFGRRREHRLSASSYTVLLVPGKLHWPPPSLRPLIILLSSSCRRIRWLDSQNPRRSPPSTRCSRIVTRVR
jgi:hypothetical protein